MRVGAGMSWHGGAGIDHSCCRVPVGGLRPKEIRSGNRHRGWMSAHEVHFWLVAVVALHIWHFGLVFENAPFWSMVLVGLGDTLEIKFVCIAFAVHLGHDVLVIVVAEGPAELVIVHVRLALSLPPALGYLVWVGHLEFSVSALPGDDGGIVAVREQLQQELPQLDLTRACVKIKCQIFCSGWKGFLRQVVFSKCDLFNVFCTQKQNVGRSDTYPQSFQCWWRAGC